MKNANYLRAALTLGALTLMSGGANAQTQGRATNGTSGTTTNGVIQRNPNTGNAANGYYGGAGYTDYNYGFYGNPFMSSGYNGNAFYGGGYGNGYGGDYGGGGYGNPYGNPYGAGNGGGNAGMNGYGSPYSPFDSGYGNGSNGYGANYPGYYDPYGYYQNDAGSVVPADPNLNPNAPQNSGAAARTAAPAARILPRTTDTVEAKRMTNNRFYIGWTGENSAVNKITFAMLDLKKHAIMTRTVTQPPGEYTFPITSRMVYYQVVIEYVNGTTSTVTSPL